MLVCPILALVQAVLMRLPLTRKHGHSRLVTGGPFAPDTLQGSQVSQVCFNVRLRRCVWDFYYISHLCSS